MDQPTKQTTEQTGRYDQAVTTEARTERRQGVLGKTVVVTGASSGIGRAVALEFAQRGWDVVAIARQDEALRQLTQETEQYAGTMTAHAADVTSRAQLESAAQHAIERYDTLDVWVNDAAVSAMGPFDQIPDDVFRQVIDTDLMGYMNGTHVAMQRFKQQGHGTLINVASAAAKVAQPYAVPYTVAKAGIAALGQALRAELADQPRIHVCTVYPASVDTPFFQHTADFMGQEVKPLPPVYPAEDVARAIVSCAEKPTPELYVGATPRMWRLQRAFLPKRLEERAFERMVRKGHFSEEERMPYRGNLFQPDTAMNSVSGGWAHSAGGTRGRVLKWSAVGLGLAAASGLGAWLWLRRPHGHG